MKQYLPLFTLIFLAFVAFLMSSARGLPQRFSIKDHPPDGNVGYIAVIEDSKTYRSYPVYDFNDDKGQYLGPGVASLAGGYCVLMDVRGVSK